MNNFASHALVCYFPMRRPAATAGLANRTQPTATQGNPGRLAPRPRLRGGQSEPTAASLGLKSAFSERLAASDETSTTGADVGDGGERHARRRASSHREGHVANVAKPSAKRTGCAARAKRCCEHLLVRLTCAPLPRKSQRQARRAGNGPVCLSCVKPGQRPRQTAEGQQRMVEDGRRTRTVLGVGKRTTL